MKLPSLPWRPAFKALLIFVRYSAAAVALYLAWKNTDDAICAVMNLSLFFLPFTLALAISGRRISSLSIASCFSIFLYVLGELKFEYFGDRLAVADYSFVTEPANWIIVWRYPLLWQTLAAFMAFVALLVIDALYDSRGSKSLSARWRWLAAAVFVSLLAFNYSNRQYHMWEVFRDDANCGDMNTCGVMSRLVYSISVFEFEPPQHTEDPTLFVTKKDLLTPLRPTATALPDIVIWLNESTFNPQNFRLPNARLPRMEMFEENDRTRASGLMRTHTFGGKTWLSEFSMLTGMLPDDFGARRSLVFNTVSPKLNSTLVSLLKANGYATVVLMPTPKRFYGAARTYAALGFDRILTLRDFPEYDKIKGDEWDIADSDRLSDAARKLITEHRKGADGSKPIFVYMLSVHEHAPYSDKTKIEYNLGRSGLSQKLAAKFTHYVNKLRTLNVGVTAMDKYLAASERPMLFTYFGDHQAYYEDDSPPYRFKFTRPENITQFQIRTNYGSHMLPRLPLTDIALVPSLVADFAGVKQDKYFEALSAIRRLCEGKLDDCEDQALVKSYKGYIFSEGLGEFRQ
ncbi:sulfatase-like hydrolase/transferase [Stenotrophobium rhamnosiphilum]|uniref:Sulfatase N-terminal domain-containing protein n=1 Tax=Stenotrophobium rhamnosiphilum TaxID=2029166 RepID=A0A2T5MK62_9GAMM|nr:sulfatase-like hydrolase/transferase [Stenotrophobium rhamnosiphilum]PTU32939.1 hypothetical protein CJD38_02170 [Stenotrophobium rhamnosiphilum]